MNLIGAGPCIIEAHPNRGGVSCKTPGLMLHFRMMYKSRFSFRRLVFFFVLSQFFLPLIAQIGSGGISVKAQSWRRDENSIIAWGNVEIELGGIHLNDFRGKMDNDFSRSMNIFCFEIDLDII
ncbi:MAG: hypothetical protein KKD59_04380, partial [Acidobacteria bacterium]|nr:hypothetical protein [Acidobacteriota bacterium]